MTSFKCISPADDSVVVEREYMDGSQVDSTLELSSSAQLKWSTMPISERMKIVERAVDAFVALKSEIADEISVQMGRPRDVTPFEINGFEERARHMLEIAASSLVDVEPAAKPGFVRRIQREPLGVVFVIAPWNYPYLTAVNAIVPALLAGNSVVLKHSVQTPLCAERLMAAFEQAGMPAGVFQYIHISHGETERVIGSGRVNFVAFTGSVAGGKMVERAASGRFIGTGLELGGKDPAYIRHDAHLQNAIETVADGAFFNSGQSCCGIERVYVHKSVFDDVVDGVCAIARAHKLGDPRIEGTTLGPMVKASAADFVRDQILQATGSGAVAHIDEHAFDRSRTGSAYLAPQVLTGVDHTMRVMTEESFGPVIGIMSVEGDAQAIELMNDSDFGLTACVFTEDLEAAVDIGNQVQTGTWFMNRCDYLDPALAWTGVKNSGRGCTLSSIGFEHMTRPKSFHLRTEW
ncbi:MAG: aldehyde dehydrogenase family protein [Pseudomonadota bacterium]